MARVSLCGLAPCRLPLVAAVAFPDGRPQAALLSGATAGAGARGWGRGLLKLSRGGSSWEPSVGVTWCVWSPWPTCAPPGPPEPWPTCTS